LASRLDYPIVLFETGVQDFGLHFQAWPLLTVRAVKGLLREGAGEEQNFGEGAAVVAQLHSYLAASRLQ